MPRIRSLMRVPAAPQAAEVFEPRLMLSAKQTPPTIVDANVNGQVYVQALNSNFGVTGNMKVTGIAQPKQKLDIDITINPPGGVLQQPLKISGSLKVVSREVAGNQLTIVLDAPKSLNVPVTFNGHTYNFSAKPKDKTVTLVVDTSTMKVVSFNVAYSLQKIPTFTTTTTDVNVSLFSP